MQRLREYNKAIHLRRILIEKGIPLLSDMKKEKLAWAEDTIRKDALRRPGAKKVGTDKGTKVLKRAEVTLVKRNTSKKKTKMHHDKPQGAG